ncbi:peroxisome biogenesis protein 16 isoform X2 [Malania oleifera]|uniref:peroxisome biogenesis protein 16 isoform X2 n=1 Tax=Malania oleifera TaxID=397392 RepID=UPI0025AE188E|nr:peroxisome biogenesis protein 16 isoform X2 [Malania oleifera]XP_057979835.1 peroxisome biogenesis protein 16 isoform X2 [Malania oleifera]
MEAYKRWVRANKDYVHSLESLANGLTWFLPERFSESEIGPEAVTTILGIITAINEHIIDTTPTWIQRGSAEPSSFPYALCISAIKDLETLVEVAAQQIYGDDKKWNFIAITEATKVLVRMIMFWNSGCKMLLQGGQMPNVEEDSDTSSSQHTIGNFTGAGGHGPVSLWDRHRQDPHNPERWALSALNRFGENARMASGPTWLQRLQHQNAITNPPTPVAGRPSISTILSKRGLLGGLFVMCEVLHITRPFIYVLLIRKYGLRSWMPWFLSLAVDLFGMGILSLIAVPQHSSRKDQQFLLSASENGELKRRKLLWALYLMRDPFFCKYTRQRLEGTEKLMEPVPIIGFLTAKIVELIVGAQTRYTYMSGS